MPKLKIKIKGGNHKMSGENKRKIRLLPIVIVTAFIFLSMKINVLWKEYNNKKQISEIVIDDMIILDNKGNNGEHMAVEGADLAVGEAPTEVTPDVVSESGNIEDIVIPDDIDADQAPKNTEEAKNDEMPF